MITEDELLEAIKECQEEPITYGKCEKLASFYIIYDHLYGDQIPGAFFSSQKKQNKIFVKGESEFLRTVNGLESEKVWSVLDELLETIKVINPHLYDGVLRKLE